MTKQVPWFRVLVEGAVIVGSILMAFGIDAWWASQGDAALERSYLEGMQAEFEAAEAELEGLIVVHQARASGLHELHRLLRTGDGAAVPDSVIVLSHMLWRVSPFVPEMPTYQNLIESRGPSLIRDDRVREALRTYEVALGSNREWDDYLVAFDNDLMVALLVPRLPYFSEIFGDGDFGGQLRPDIDELAGDLELRNLIAIRYDGERILVARRTELVEAVRLVRQLLVSALAD